MEEQNRRERREKEREYWFQDSLLSLSCCVFPAARSPRIGHLQDCAVVPERPAALWGTTTSISIHPYLRSSFWSLSFPQTRSLLIRRFSSSRRYDDWLTDIHFPLLFSQLFSYCSPVFTLRKEKVFHNLPSFWPLFKMRQSMRVGRVSLWNSLFVIRSFFLQSHFPKPRESETENETISCDIWVCYCGTIVPFSLEREREKDKTNLCPAPGSYFLWYPICAWASFDCL